MFDVLVIGGGHAGCEAATAAARRGARVGLVTFSAQNLGQLSCNPSIGGVGKGHLVREVDVFDGLIATAADAAAIHYRMLNRSKGSAVQGPRLQADRHKYCQAISQAVVASGVQLVIGEVVELSLEHGNVSGVVLADGSRQHCRAVVIATGTFLGATIFRGDQRRSGGRTGEPGAIRLADQFRDLGMAPMRLKTGTPPRLDGRTIDWSRLERQPSDRQRWSMSSMGGYSRLPQLDCAITRTLPATHEVIATNFHRSPLFSGAIEGRGPRYCPSIEDKVRRFADRDSHQIFLEPEGLDTAVVYPNGLSTSLPTEVQVTFLRTIPGLERVDVVAPGYAVEYATLDPRLLGPALAKRNIPGLFLAGQINGTTGYEEAAAQGLVAGLNAAAHACELAPVRFDRATSYIGVMIDDLTLQGVSEPYRMMTARAEFRLHLRADNALTRLGGDAVGATCIGSSKKRLIERNRASYIEVASKLDEQVAENNLVVDGSFERRSLRDWLARPDRRAAVAARVGDNYAAREVLNDIEYAPYLARQRAEWSALQGDRRTAVPGAFNYATVPGLSHEMIERLGNSSPETLEQASRVSGITPAALTALHFALVSHRD